MARGVQGLGTLCFWGYEGNFLGLRFGLGFKVQGLGVKGLGDLWVFPRLKGLS